MQQNKIAILFPGQGSQYLGMGEAFLETDSDAEQLMELAESVSSSPIKRLCLEGPMEDLTQAVNLQPALTTANLICWQAVEKAGIVADYFAGHSLGEYSALCAAGVLSKEDTLRLVTERGKLSDREGTKNPGGMQAILGLTLDEVEKILFGLSSDGVAIVANHNTETQIVISGENEALQEVEGIVAERGGRAITLNVSVANHSPLIAGAVPDFEKVLNSIPFSAPGKPVLFNVTGVEEADPDEIRSIMTQQIVSRVRWFEIINNLKDKGVNIFIEVGPKTILKGLLKKIVPRSAGVKTFQVDTPETLAKCVDGIAAL
jgi:[acyl-carrier-protein] S-malonyltransferase